MLADPSRLAFEEAPGWPLPSRTAFVLSGGGGLGAMQVGMLRALYEQGIVPDFLVGTSAGAMNAAFIATRPQTVATAKELGQVWSGMHHDDLFPINPRMLLGGFTNHRDHVVSDRAMRRVIGHYLQVERLEQAPIPLHLVAFDLHAGMEVLLSEGPALESILAAAAIPGLLPPVHIGDRMLIDGGVVNNTPISHAVELGAERIYVLPTDDPATHSQPGPAPGALDSVVHAVTLLTSARLTADLARFAGAAELIVLPATNPHRVQATDFAHSSRLIGAALDSSRTALAIARPAAAIGA